MRGRPLRGLLRDTAHYYGTNRYIVAYLFEKFINKAIGNYHDNEDRFYTLLLYHQLNSFSIEEEKHQYLRKLIGDFLIEDDSGYEGMRRRKMKFWIEKVIVF